MRSVYCVILCSSGGIGDSNSGGRDVDGTGNGNDHCGVVSYNYVNSICCIGG